jgi:hypothetical protein
MCRSYGIATHVFEHRQLVTDCRLLTAAPSGPQIVVITYAFDFLFFPVKEKSLIWNDLNGSDSECSMVHIGRLA